MSRLVFDLVLLLFVVRASAADLRVGAAQVKITPSPGTPMAGYYHERAADGVLDDLFARAIVLELDGVKAALVSLDLISTTRPMVVEARRLVQEATGIPGSHVMISATHAHTGPVVSDPSNPRYDVLGGQRPEAMSYGQRLPGWIAEAVKRAHEGRQPAYLRATVGREESIAFNRRYHMRDGSVGWNPGKRNPEIVKPAGPVDPALPFVYFEGTNGSPIAVYANYSVHLDNVGGARISADLPHALGRALSMFKGTNLVTVYTTGTCGDVNHINVNWAEPQSGPGNAARMGVILAGEILRRWQDLRSAGPGPLRVASEIVPLPLAPVTDADMERARAAFKRGLSDNGRERFMEAVQTFKVLDVAAREGKPIEVEVQVITLGRELAWVSLPGEIFVRLGLDLKQASPFGQTMIAELANGSIGYIPDRQAYPQGNYEVVSARCAEGSGELLVDAAVRLLKKLRPAP